MLLSSLCLLFVELGADLLPEVNVGNSLFHHEVDRFYRLLDVFGLGLEEVTDLRHAVRLLGLNDVIHVVRQALNFQNLVVTLLRAGVLVAKVAAEEVLLVPTF